MQSFCNIFIWKFKVKFRGSSNKIQENTTFSGFFAQVGPESGWKWTARARRTGSETAALQKSYPWLETRVAYRKTLSHFVRSRFAARVVGKRC